MGHAAQEAQHHQPIEYALFERLIDLARRIRERLSDRCQDRGVNPSRFAILQSLAEGSDEGCSQTELATQLGISESNVCSLVESMRATGLLFRFRSKTDRRKSVLMLSEIGRELATNLGQQQAAEAETLMAALSPQQQLELGRLVEQLHARLDSSLPLIVVSSDDSEENASTTWEIDSRITPVEASSFTEPSSRRAS